MKTTDSHIYLYGGPLSNWYTDIGLIIDPISGDVFDSSEQAFMYYKASFFGDMDIAGQILNCTNPKEVKALGRKVEGYDDKSWNCVRLGFMTYVNWLKYNQNEELKEELLQTGSRILVEASPYDKIWGVGLSEDSPLITDSKNWLGLNLLGISLMQVRKMLRS